MKYAIVILGGAADQPVDALSGLTPLEMAATPNTDALAAAGRVGTARTTPQGFAASTDVCLMDLLGYEPAQHHTGRAPLDAAGAGVILRDTDWALRLSLVTIGDDGTDQSGLMLDNSAGAIPDTEAHELFEGLVTHWRTHAPEIATGITLTPTGSHRALLIDTSGDPLASLETTPPHELHGRPTKPAHPRGPGSAKYQELVSCSRTFLKHHEVNAARAEQGLPPANLAWVWGQGTRPALPKFQDRFGIHGTMIATSNTARGLAHEIGWDTTAPDPHNEPASAASAAVNALTTHDLVCVAIDTPKHASFQGDVQSKVAAIESIDTHLIGPLTDALKTHSGPQDAPNATGWRILVTPDTRTLCSTRTHDAAPVPFCLSGSYVDAVVPRAFTESEADASDLHIERGSDLMEYVLRSGVPGTGSK